MTGVTFDREEVRLPELTISQVLSQRRTVREFSQDAIPVASLEKLIWAAQGITGADGKRTAPSAHALHPIRLVVAVGRVDGLENGFYEVDPTDLALKKLHDTDPRPGLRKSAIDDPETITGAACILIVCADMVIPGKAFAAQRPYGMRGARYVYLEAGAVAQNVQLQATSEGLGSVWVGGFNDEATANALGLQPPLTPIVEICIGYPAKTAE